MEVFTSISPNLVKKYQSYVENSSIIVLDGNLPLDTIQYLLELATYSKIPGKSYLYKSFFSICLLSLLLYLFIKIFQSRIIIISKHTIKFDIMNIISNVFL